MKQLLKCSFGLKCHINPKGSINPVFGDVYLCYCPSICLSMSQGSECQGFHAEARAVQWWIMLLWTQNQENRCDTNVEVAIKMVLELGEINDCSQRTSSLSCREAQTQLHTHEHAHTEHRALLCMRAADTIDRSHFHSKFRHDL